MLSGLTESMLALAASVGVAAIGRAILDVGKAMFASFGFLAFVALGKFATLFMPPNGRSK